MLDAFLFEPGIIAEEVSNIPTISECEENYGEEGTNKTDCDCSDIETDNEKEGSSNKISGEMDQHHPKKGHPYVTEKALSCIAKYVDTFVAPNTSINIRDGVGLYFCKGTSLTRGHFFPAFEESFECHQCHQSFCRTCTFVPSIDNNKKNKVYYNDGCDHSFCIECFKYHRLGNNADEDDSILLSEAEMSRELNEKFGLQLSDQTATFGETMDIYEAYINSPDNIHNKHLDLVKKVKYSLFSSSSL